MILSFQEKTPIISSPNHIFFSYFNKKNIVTEKVVVLTVATDDNHGLQRFLRSAKVYNIDVEVLGMGRKWTGGNMDFPGGGMKVNLLKEKLTTLDMKEDTIVLFTDRFVVL